MNKEKDIGQQAGFAPTQPIPGPFLLNRLKIPTF